MNRSPGNVDECLAAEPERRNRFAQRPMLAALVLLTGIVILLECILRILPTPLLDFAFSARQVYRYHDRWYTDFRPGHRTRLTLPDRGQGNILDFEIAVDDRGLRLAAGNDIDESDATVIHAIGDSFTMGWGVDGDAAYPAQLDRLLGPGFDVVNLGVNGFGAIGATEKSAQFVASAGTQPPDLVIYLATENDYDDDDIALRHADRPAWLRGVLDVADGFRRTFLVSSLPFAGRWALQLAGLEAADLSDSTEPNHLIRVLDDDPPLDHQPDWGLPSKAALRRYVDDLREGTEMLVVTHGRGPMVRDLAAFCRSIDLPVLRLEFDPRLIIPRDGHLTEEGNRRLAAIIAQHLPSPVTSHLPSNS